MAEKPGAILVVDDAPDMRALLCDELSERGYRVAAAASGREALKKLGEEDCAVVLTDLRMQGMQGLELLSEVKRDYPGTNVIIMTAFGSVESAIEAMKQGAYDYVTKPIKN